MEALWWSALTEDDRSRLGPLLPEDLRQAELVQIDTMLERGDEKNRGKAQTRIEQIRGPAVTE